MGIRPGVYSCQQACREVAAFVLDHGGFHGVPPTVMVGGFFRFKRSSWIINSIPAIGYFFRKFVS